MEPSYPEKNGTTFSHSPTAPAPAPASLEAAPTLPHPLERRVVRRVDLTLLPTLWMLFLVSFVDRGNIGNAKIAGMVKTLHLTGNRYNIAFQVFVVAYVACAVPANIVFKRLGPRTLPVMIFGWGLCVVGQGLTKSYGGLVACRFLEGVMEAGFVPGAAYLIASYYRSDEFLKRYSFFFGASLVAGAFNGVGFLLIFRFHFRGIR